MKWILGLVVAIALVSVGHSQDSPYRKELKRANLSGTNMVVVTSISEIQPGQLSMLHIHHGEEAFYVIEGGTIELPDGKQVPFPTGATNVNARDVPHGAFKVVGDKPLKFVTVHIVDKDQPL
jgi:quercetin dioxygenase-like cupin family protein